MCHSLSLLPLLLLVYLPLMAPAQAEPVSVLDGGFEQVQEKTGLPLGWTPWTTANQCFYTLATAHSGVASAIVTDDSETMSQGLRSQPVAIEAGRTYEATAWVKISELKAGAFALYLEYWCGTERVKNVAVSATTVGEWQPLTISAPAPANATAATLLVYGSSATVGIAYFDDIALRPSP